MSDSPIGIDLKPEKIHDFNQKMQNLYYANRPEYEECLLRCKILNLVNDIWQTHLYENELDLMHDESHRRYRDIITKDTFVELESIPNPRHYNKPYRKYGPFPSDPNKSRSQSRIKRDTDNESRDTEDDNISSKETKELKDENEEESESGNGTDTKSRDKDDIFSGSEEKSNKSMSAMSAMTMKTIDSADHDDNDEQFNHWCTPIEGEQKVIIIREYEGGPVIKRVIIPSVMIFGSIAFGLDGFGSDVDLALPASISNPAVNAHKDTNYQSKLLKAFMSRFNMEMKKSSALGLKWKIEPILHARVPIIKLTETRLTGGKLQCDIGIRSTQMPITKLIRYYCEYDDRISIFYTFIKQWSKCRQIAEAMYGFPNSFGFVMLVTKYLQLLEEPLLPITDYDRKLKQLICIHDIDKFKFNTMTLMELAISFFDYYFQFDFETYQIDITLCGLQWKHGQDYNLNHPDQETMLVVDPSSKSENVTRCLKPYNLKIMRQEFFRGYKCAMNGDWDLLFTPFNQKGEISIFEIYPPINQYELDIRYELEPDDGDEHLNDDFEEGNVGYTRWHNNSIRGDHDEHSYQKIHKISNNHYQYKKKNNNNNNNNSHKKQKHGKSAKISNNKKYIKKKQNFERSNY